MDGDDEDRAGSGDNAELTNCPHCGRTFFPDRLAKHVNVCETGKKKGVVSKRHSKWGVLDPQPPPVEYRIDENATAAASAQLEPCPHCGRTFFPDRLPKHLALCPQKNLTETPPKADSAVEPEPTLIAEPDPEPEPVPVIAHVHHASDKPIPIAKHALAALTAEAHAAPVQTKSATSLHTSPSAQAQTQPRFRKLASPLITDKQPSTSSGQSEPVLRTSDDSAVSNFTSCPACHKTIFADRLDKHLQTCEANSGASTPPTSMLPQPLRRRASTGERDKLTNFDSATDKALELKQKIANRKERAETSVDGAASTAWANEIMSTMAHIQDILKKQNDATDNAATEPATTATMSPKRSPTTATMSPKRSPTTQAAATSTQPTRSTAPPARAGSAGTTATAAATRRAGPGVASRAATKEGDAATATTKKTTRSVSPGNPRLPTKTTTTKLTAKSITPSTGKPKAATMTRDMAKEIARARAASVAATTSVSARDAHVEEAASQADDATAKVDEKRGIVVQLGDGAGARVLGEIVVNPSSTTVQEMRKLICDELGIQPTFVLSKGDSRFTIPINERQYHHPVGDFFRTSADIAVVEVPSQPARGRK